MLQLLIHSLCPRSKEKQASLPLSDITQSNVSFTVPLPSEITMFRIPVASLSSVSVTDCTFWLFIICCYFPTKLKKKSQMSYIVSFGKEL